jgi:hypothetical protein
MPNKVDTQAMDRAVKAALDIPTAPDKAVDVMYANVRGLRQAAAQLRQRVTAQGKHPPVFIVLTETHLDGDSLDAELLPPGYKVFARRDRTKHGGGVLILGLATLLVDELDLDQYYTAGLSEIVGIEFQDFQVFGAYTQNSAAAPVLFESLCKIRESDEYGSKKSLFLMDANAHHEEWLGSTSTDAAGECALAFSELYGLPQFVDFPTREDAILDLCYCDYTCVTTALPHLGTSDHVTVTIRVDPGLDLPPPPPKRSVYHWSNAPWNHIRGHLKRATAEWHPDSFETVDDTVDDFYRLIDQTVTRYVRSTVPTSSRPASWWDRSCTTALKAVDKAFESRSTNKEGYESARQVLKTRQRQAYAKYRKLLVAKLDTDDTNKDWWDTVKLHSGKARSPLSGTPSPQELAEFFAAKLSLGGEEDDEVPDFQPVTQQRITSLRVTQRRVKKVLSTLNPRKSMHGISNRFLKECAKVLTPAITRLFQRIARDAVWPSRWKVGRISAIWKKGKRSQPKNYRPVMVLDCLSLVMERVIDPQFTTFLAAFESDCQYAFKKHCGTQDYGAAFSMSLHQVLEQHLEAFLVALDVAGAFDKVWWKALLKNLHHCGMRGKAHQLLSSYLCARFLFVVAAGVASAILEFFCGAPQGGIWSPKLWNFHIREMTVDLKFTKPFKYADDLGLLKTINTVSSLLDTNRSNAIAELNSDLKTLFDYGQKWKVTFEPDKSHAMLVSNTRDCMYPSVSQLVLGDGHITFVEELLVVGFLVDRKLTWRPMINRTRSKGRRALGGVRMLRDLLKPSDRATLYKSFVRSTIEYGLIEYRAAAPSNLAKLDEIQHSAEKLCETKFTPLGDRRDAAAFGLLCKLLEGECIGQLQALAPEFDVHVPERFSSRVNDSYYERPRLVDPTHTNSLDSFRRSFACQVHRIFDRIPIEIIHLGQQEGWRMAMKPGQRFLSSQQQ